VSTGLIAYFMKWGSFRWRFALLPSILCSIC